MADPKNMSFPKGRVVDFKPIEEAWNLYKIGDGNYLRVKFIVTKVTITNQINPDGKPVYFVNGQPAFMVFSADEIQKLYKPDLQEK